jgi:hypothetical protein
MQHDATAGCYSWGKKAGKMVLSYKHIPIIFGFYRAYLYLCTLKRNKQINIVYQ